MDSVAVDRLVQELSAGFGALQDEYQKLYGQHQALERKLANAREQYNELAKLYKSEQTATPPLSLTSSPGQPTQDVFAPRTVAEILDTRPDIHAKDAANKVRSAISAAQQLRSSLPLDTAAHGVKIWSGPSADKPEGSSSMMPSISESPLEQDFTVEGKPSQLGCPFAAMAKKKKLSSHAASVLSRYERNAPNGSVAASTPVSQTSYVNGRDSFSRRGSRRASFVDPIKAEICGLSDHNSASPAASPAAEKAPSKGPEQPQIENAEVGVCPIRFLDQHSPEEVATYFEKHKNELPRSHEVCILRYQSNEEQIKQLDAKYGNLVSMIQGLGQRHKEMLPEDPDPEEQDEERHDDAVSDEKIRKWASSVSAQAPQAGDVDEDEEEDRLPHFERPVREIRVGESPSRPWGISVPARYYDKAESERSSQPVQVNSPAIQSAKQQGPEIKADPKPAGKCPFDHKGLQAMGITRPQPAQPAQPASQEPGTGATKPEPAPAAEPAKEKEKAKPQPETDASTHKASAAPQIVINGPLFIGYSPEDAIRILRESGLKVS
ncbi:hypothetical protein HII31_02361 [Pseudocercospora fuligena]|uniref:Uncharacterized protein n=1 Tax=Pseudocercospora fuligena TaxID=685502 RepID=A0A8H6RSA7_9PEZI|nr:hypothetical protein HII31_02361 [Pseudocercospora fuligena]